MNSFWSHSSGKAFITINMKIRLNGMLNKMGLDGTVLAILSNKIWGMVSHLVLLYLVITYFTEELQGFFYTFMGLTVFQVLFELGFNIVLLQFISHEWAHLSFGPDGTIEGDQAALSRLRSLVKLGLSWYLIIAIALFALLGYFGLLFLESKNEPGLSISVSWWLLCGGTVGFMLTSPLRFFLEGSKQVARSHWIMLALNVTSAIAGCLCILYGARLVVPGIMAGIKAILGLCLLVPACWPFFCLLRLKRKEATVAWRCEFWPQQWRIGLSWLCGLLMYQAFVPIIFYFHGPAVAGKMGAGMQIFHAVNILAGSWLLAVQPRFGMLGARGDYTGLRRLAKRTVVRSMGMALAISVCVTGGLSLMQYYDVRQADRFPELFPMLVLLVTVILLQLPNVETAAIRFQKTEPFLINSLVNAALIFSTSIILGRMYGILGIVVGFSFIMMVVVIPWCHRIYTSKIKDFLSMKEVKVKL